MMIKTQWKDRNFSYLFLYIFLKFLKKYKYNNMIEETVKTQ